MGALRRVVTLHLSDECNRNCPFCYRKKEKGENNLPFSFFIDMVPYLAEVTEQVAVGGGELYYACPEFVEEFSKACDEHGLICNITTNGTLPDKIIKHSKYITMASVSFDRYKVKNLREHMLLLHKLRESGLRIGTNLLIDNEMFKPPAKFAKLVELLFMESERVFALYPKNWEFVPILDYRDYYLYLSLRYKHFYVDDTTSKILTEKRYDNWRTSCHIARDAININNDGSVTGCSFSDKVLMRLEEPRDVLKIKDVEAEEIHSCPYIQVP